MGAKPILASFVAFVLASAVVIGLTSFKYGYDGDFYKNILVEAHGMLLDILVIGIFIFALHKLGEKRLDNKRYHDEIDDFKFWESEEAKFRIIGNIKRLNRNDITNIDISYCYLKNAELGGVQLQGADLLKINLQGATLFGSNLQQTDLGFANLQEANLGQANLQEADLSKADIQKAVLVEANLQGANLMEANLEEADIGFANLKKSNLEDANLQGADLTDAFLQEANLAGANLEKTNLLGANLKGAELLYAKMQTSLHLGIEQLTQAKTLYNAKLNQMHMEIIKKDFPHLLEKPWEE